MPFTYFLQYPAWSLSGPYRASFSPWQWVFLSIIILMYTNCNQPSTVPCHQQQFTWHTLPPIPDNTGFAGSFAGVADGALIVAGGANFPNGGAPWKGSAKKWYADIFILESTDGQWKKAGTLPTPLGYGVSITTTDGLILIGGSHEKGHEARVWRLHYQKGQVQIDSLPSLPFPLANACGALAGNTIYVAGGLTGPDSLNTEALFLSLDLTALNKSWESLPAWPGPSRMLSVAGASNDTFYLFSGTQLINGQRQYLKDAYAYTPAKGWQSLPDLPAAVVAAPSPAWQNPEGSLFIFGGDDGKLATANLQEKHPGFSDHILQYDAKQQQWQQAGTIYTHTQTDAVDHPNNSTWAPVTTTFVQWNNQLIFPGGEVRPATRTPNVLMAQPCEANNKQ